MLMDMNVEGVVLAAGLSTRTGTYKLTLDIDGKTVIERCIEPMYDICSRIIVVGGHKYEVILKVLNKYSKIDVVFNENYMDGMFSSVKTGLRNVHGEKVLFIPGDYPLINRKTYRELLNVNKDIVIPVYNSQKGHPVLFKSHVIQLLYKSEYTNLREFISWYGFSTIEVDDSGILIDIDTMEDYKKIINDSGKFI